MSLPELSPELSAALEAADAADAVIAPLFRSNLAVETKADRTPVTEADRRAEEAIRAVLQRRFPHYGFYGEEGGQHGMQAESIWLVDPLDGTKSFVRDTPFFSTQIALMRRGELVLGVSSACAAGERAWAEQGAGAWLNGERIRVSDRRELSDAIVSSGNLKRLATGPQWSAFGRLIGEVNRIRGYGDFVHYHLLARGALDLVIESDVNILDIAALAVIVREAGGVFTDLAGRPLDLHSTSVLASNGPLHQAVLDRIQFES
ncbi:MAG TPA: inositol monophosphatase family protein [Steroidobacteraceae bacterium]|nr:inositol monophosphatase family protein [Steroidobacteraceae bacterium]